MTHRLLGVLIERLPPESATKTALRDALPADEQARRAEAAKHGGGDASRLGAYSNTDMHLGQLIDELRWLRFAVYHAQGGKPKKPDPYPRPGVATRNRQITPEARAYLANIRAQNAANRPAAPAAVVPPHIETAQPKRLGPAEKKWIAEQLAAMNAANRQNPDRPNVDKPDE